VDAMIRAARAGRDSVRTPERFPRRRHSGRL
jgi:hypothetical protein